MFEMNSDRYRQQELMNASLSAKREGAEFYKSPLYVRLTDMREKEARKQRRRRRRFPIITVLSLLACVPFFMDGGGAQVKTVVAQSQLSPEQQIDHIMRGNEAEEVQDNKVATVHVTIDGKTVSKEISVADLQKLQAISPPPVTD